MTIDAMRFISFVALAQKGSLGIRLDQRSGFQRIRRTSFELGLQPRRPYTKRPERPALAKATIIRAA
jgi:hypothetical protein